MPTFSAVFSPVTPGMPGAWSSAQFLACHLADADMPLYRELTGREDAPTSPARESWLIAGRRSAKSRKAACIGVYLATIGAEVSGYRERLAPGERGVVLVLAVDRAQAAVTLAYARAFLGEVPMLAAMIERDAGGEIDLTNRMSLIVAANDYRSIRGRTLIAVIMDEIAFWRGEGSQRPDLEVYRAVKPGLATMPGSDVDRHFLALSSGWLALAEVQEALVEAWSDLGDQGCDRGAQPADRPAGHR